MNQDFEYLNAELEQRIDKTRLLQVRLEENKTICNATMKNLQIDNLNFQLSKPNGFYQKLKFLFRVAAALFRTSN